MNNELYHYGVKGMKWGVRKSEYRTARNGAKAERKARNTARLSKIRNYTGGRGSAALKEYRAKDINSMSDADLQRAVNRMNLEKQYRNLTKIDIVRGKTEADRMLGYHDTYRKTKRVVKTTKAATKVATKV